MVPVFVIAVMLSTQLFNRGSGSKTDCCSQIIRTFTEHKITNQLTCYLQQCLHLFFFHLPFALINTHLTMRLFLLVNSEYVEKIWTLVIILELSAVAVNVACISTHKGIYICYLLGMVITWLQ